MNSGIYTITNTLDGKIYVGYAIDFDKRKRCHWSELKRNNHSNVHLQHAVNLYGIDCFRFEILEKWEENYLCSMENYWAVMLDSHNKEKGYNIQPTGPNKTIRRSEETKLKSSLSQKGRILTADHIAKIKEKRKLQVITEAHKANTRRAILGRKDSEAVKKYKSEVAKRRGVSSAFRAASKKAVIQYSKEEVFIAKYESIAEAARLSGVNPNTITTHCKGRVQTINRFTKFIWKLTEE